MISDQLGGATRWWLEKSLLVLDRAIAELGDVSANMIENPALRLFTGKASGILDTIIESQPVGALFWNRLYDKPSITRDTEIKAAMMDRGLTCESFKAQLLFEPWEVKTGGGTDFKVFSPFWRACQKAPPPPTCAV